MLVGFYYGRANEQKGKIDVAEFFQGLPKRGPMAIPGNTSLPDRKIAGQSDGRSLGARSGGMDVEAPAERVFCGECFWLPFDNRGECRGFAYSRYRRFYRFGLVA